MRRATSFKTVYPLHPLYPVSIAEGAGTLTSRRRLRPALLALSIAAAFTSLPIASQSILPVHRNDLTGSSARALNAAGTKLTVTTTNGVGTNHSAINWQSFSIGAGNTTQFVQPGANSTSINRVITNTPSQIYGTLSSNGKLVLVNQSGITVGAGAVVDTAGFTASVLGMSDVDAATGRMRFSADSLGNGTGALVVQGNVIARGGDVVLIAPSVEVAKTAVVEAQGGAVMLAAGQKVSVTGRGLEGIVMQVQAPGDSAVNLGTLRGDAVGIFASQLKHSGLIQAVGADVQGGKVVLRANDVAEITGRIEARRITTSATNGGDVTISARYAVVTGVIDASGQQGGNITVDAQSVLQAAPLTVAGVTSGGMVLIRGSHSVIQTAEASINASASQGAGGSIVVQADSADGSGGTVLTSGVLNASGAGAGAGASGGTIKVLGSTIRLQGAQISADGDADGGNLLVGGNKHGNDPLTPNSQYLYVNSATVLSARSRRAGSGGDVVLWSDGTTRYFGSIDASGAGAGGNGGWVEVSGKESLQFAGPVAAAGGPGGARGTLLLDPKNLTIANASGQLGVLELADPNNEAGGAGNFGASIINIGSNRVLVTDPFDTAGGTNAGAIYIYDKTTGGLLSALTGSHNGDFVGSNYQSVNSALVFKANAWNSNLGAWTWIQAGSTASLPGSGVISSANSLLGTAANDLASASLYSVANGRNLLVASSYGGGAGALATFAGTGFAGTLDSTNALVGSVATDNIGNYGAISLPNNYYAVFSRNWGGTKGAITVIDTAQALSGVLSSANSLVGSATGDFVGNTTGAFRQFSNGKVMVFSSQWGGGKGAFTVFDSASLVKGTVDASTSLVGSSTSDGSNFFVQNCFTYGSCASYFSPEYFLITNPQWNGGMGSVTVLDQTVSAAFQPVGTLSTGNSLIGNAGDQVGSGGVTVYGSKLFVSSPTWGSGKGAVTFVDGSSVKVKGLVNISEPNTVVGTAVGDFNGMATYSGVVPNKLLLIAPNYGSGKGAMAFLGDSGVSGVLDDGKSLIGTNAGDRVGSGGFTTASTYWVLKSPNWQSNTGAITIFEPGVTGTSPKGFINSSLNSWTGLSQGDRVGSADMTFVPFANNNAVVVNRLWGSGAAASGPGAITLITRANMQSGVVAATNSWTGKPGSTDGAGMTVKAFSSSGIASLGYPYLTNRVVVSNPAFDQNRGFVAIMKDSDLSLAVPGPISSSNSLIGGLGDQVGSVIGSIYGSSGGTLVINSPQWGGGFGAITFFNLNTGTLTPGVVASGNSLVGTNVGDLDLTASGSAKLYVRDYGDSRGLNRIDSMDAGHALLVASTYGGGKGAIVNIDLNAPPLTNTLNGASNALLGAAGDQIGSGGVMRQQYGGNRVLVFSPLHNASTGAVTSVDTASLLPVGQQLTLSNSFLGASTGDRVGNGGASFVTEFVNGNLLFLTPSYKAGSTAGAGAMTLLAANGVMGTIGTGNSLVGSTTGDFNNAWVYRYASNVAFVGLPSWRNTAASASLAGAMVRLDAQAAAPSGVISNTNAFVGTHAGDAIGTQGDLSVYFDGIKIQSQTWNGNKGLATFTQLTSPLVGNADTPTGGSSILGTAPGDLSVVDYIFNTGKRVMLAPNYGGGSGAIFNIDIAAGFASGTLSSINAMVGSTSSDRIGSGGYFVWGNNGYIVGSPSWNSATGALTLSDAAGVFATGVVGASNSMVGAQANDRVGNSVSSSVPLENGKLVLINNRWGIGASTASSGLGAITLLQNPSRASGVIDASNSLVGVAVGDGTYDAVRIYGDITNSNFNRVMITNSNFNGGRGMVTQIDGTSAVSPRGTINESNSLVGSNSTDRVGLNIGIDASFRHSILIGSPNWSGNAGAITSFGIADAMPTGFVSAANSLVGAQAGDQFGAYTSFPGTLLPAYNSADTLFHTSYNTLAGNKGGVTFFRTGATGMLSASNTVYGTTAGSGFISVNPDTGTRYRATFSQGSGRVVYIDPTQTGPAASTVAPNQRFDDSAGSDVTVTPQSITAMTNAGMDVFLQANNDILVNAAITTVPTAQSGGSLLLDAGRSILINANITTAGGDLGLRANSPNAQAAYRDPGRGGIATAPGVTLNLGGGDMIARVGTGVDGAPGGDIVLGQIKGADGLFVQNLSTTPGSGISQEASTFWDTRVLAMETHADNGAIGTLAQAITFNGKAMAVRALGSAPANIHHTGTQL
ncbi:MAG: filamentous hemagglutinin N-terminal domain-containing protein, partial [Bdellovibrionales bacterium]|nr:filamentous hemagglutinin N-terminal domain-containing protein [Ramlibacter sp.]